MSRPSRVRNIERLYHIYISRYILTRTLLFLPADLFWSFSLYNCITLVFYQYVFYQYTAMLMNFILSHFPKLFQQNFFLSNGIMFVLLRFYFVFRFLKIFHILCILKHGTQRYITFKIIFPFHCALLTFIFYRNIFSRSV